MERRTPTREHAAQQDDAVRVARLRRDRALTPAQRLDKLAAICRQAASLRRAKQARGSAQ